MKTKLHIAYSLCITSASQWLMIRCSMKAESKCIDGEKIMLFSLFSFRPCATPLESASKIWVQVKWELQVEGCPYQNQSFLMYVVVWIHWFPLYLVSLPAISPSNLVDLYVVLLVLCPSICSHWIWGVAHQLPLPRQNLVGEISNPWVVPYFLLSFYIMFGFRACIL